MPKEKGPKKKVVEDSDDDDWPSTSDSSSGTRVKDDVQTLVNPCPIGWGKVI